MFNQFLRNGPRQASDQTKRKIVQMLNGGDSSIHMEKLKISLKCPIMKTRMKISARSKICSHLQCFDLQNFLQLNEKTATWKCPICNGNASYDNLIIDQYFMSVLTAIKNLNVEEIELLQNGKWKTIGESGSNTNAKNTKVINLDEEEIVTLDDSDDDVSVERIIIAQNFDSLLMRLPFILNSSRTSFQHDFKITSPNRTTLSILIIYGGQKLSITINDFCDKTRILLVDDENTTYIMTREHDETLSIAIKYHFDTISVVTFKNNKKFFQSTQMSTSFFHFQLSVQSKNLIISGTP